MRARTIVGGGLALILGLTLRAAWAAEPTEADTLAEYNARIATHGSGPPVVDAALPPECPAGFLLWHRDVATDICAPLCSSDVDCLEGIERCVAVPLPRAYEVGSDVVDRTFVDEEPDVLEATPEEAGDQATVVAICDPFFDVDGAASADLVDVVSDEGE